MRGALLLALTLAASPSLRADPLQDCLDEATAPEEVQPCLGRRQRDAMRRLEAARATLKDLARQQDALNDSGETLEAAMAAEAAFDAYVGAGCRASARLGIGERAAAVEDLERACRVRLIDARADELEALLEPRG
jgi:hypothetical protein